MKEPVFLTERQVAARYGVHQNTVRNWVASGRIIKPLVLSPGCVRWRLADIEAWEEEKSSGAIQSVKEVSNGQNQNDQA